MLFKKLPKGSRKLIQSKLEPMADANYMKLPKGSRKL